MKREDAIKLAESAGWSFGWEMTAEAMIEFAALVAAAERERCAVAVDKKLTEGRSPMGRMAAEFIRALGDD